MNGDEEQHGDHIHNINGTRTKWTPGMCNDILTCREKAKALHSLDSCPRKPNRMKRLALWIYVKCFGKKRDMDIWEKLLKI